jgi:hypothetical protein
MNPQLFYICADSFLKWVKEHSAPTKYCDKIFLILDGHSTHRINLVMLEFSEIDDIILLRLSSHILQALQPLARSFTKALKGHVKKEDQHWILLYSDRKITRIQAGIINWTNLDVWCAN